jgi:hypothetical protein
MGEHRITGARTANRSVSQAIKTLAQSKTRALKGGKLAEIRGFSSHQLTGNQLEINADNH